MNNEEKILEMLTKHGEFLEKLTGDVKEIKGDISSLKERVDEIDARSLRSSVILETEVARDIRLVYEGQELLRQKMEELTPKGRTEALEGDVAVLKDAYKFLRQEVNELKKAQ